MTTLFLPELGLDGRGLGKARPPTARVPGSAFGKARPRTARFPAQLSQPRRRGVISSPDGQEGDY
jgi:hypothetical protein